jgi:hypothetical protein
MLKHEISTVVSKHNAATGAILTALCRSLNCHALAHLIQLQLQLQ